jgi:hypothetical protein
MEVNSLLLLGHKDTFMVLEQLSCWYAKSDKHLLCITADDKEVRIALNAL